MNSDIAHAAAYRPEDHARAAENQILNAFEESLTAIRKVYKNAPVTDHVRLHAARAREMNKAIARVDARLNELYGVKA